MGRRDEGRNPAETALKSEAARHWCEKMSGTKYGRWRYLFAQQRKVEVALASGVKSLAELAESMVVARPEPQLRLISLEDVRVKSEAFKTLLPLYSLKAATGYFGNGETVEPESWIEADGIGKLDGGACLLQKSSGARWSLVSAMVNIVFSEPIQSIRQGKIVWHNIAGRC